MVDERLAAAEAMCLLGIGCPLQQSLIVRMHPPPLPSRTADSFRFTDAAVSSSSTLLLTYTILKYLHKIIWKDRNAVVWENRCLRVDEGEAVGLHEALSWIKQLNLEQVVIEMDGKIVCDDVSAQQEDESELGYIIKSCRSFLDSNVDYQVKHVRREDNEIAHNIAS